MIDPVPRYAKPSCCSWLIESKSSIELASCQQALVQLIPKLCILSDSSAATRDSGVMSAAKACCQSLFSGICSFRTTEFKRHLTCNLLCFQIAAVLRVADRCSSAAHVVVRMTYDARKDLECRLRSCQRT